MPLFESFNLGHGFRKYFTVEQAHDPASLDMVFRIRHEVFSEDLGLAPHRGDRRLSDAFDDASLHCLIRDSAPPCEVIGCARLILAERLAADTLLPFESATRTISEPVLPDRRRVGEISMLAIRASHRRRHGEALAPISLQSEDFATREQPRFPFIPIGLFLGILSLAADVGLETLVMLSSPRLASHFVRLGIRMREPDGAHAAGKDEIPVIIDVAPNLAEMPLLLQPIWESVRQDIRRTPLAPPSI